MKADRLERWLQRIYNTQDAEILCSECLDRVSHFVDVELAGADPAAEMPEVRQHLDQCSACQEEYETLRDIARLENEGGLPASDDLTNLIP